MFQGTRKAIKVRAPDEMYERVAAEAREQELTQGDIVAHILSLHYDLPDDDPIRIKREYAERRKAEKMRMTG